MYSYITYVSLSDPLALSFSFCISRLVLIPAYTQMGSSVSGVQSAFNRLCDEYVGVVEELDAMKKE